MRRILVAVAVGCCLAGMASGQSAYNARSLEQAGLLDAAWQEYKGAAERNPQDLAAYEGLVRLSGQVGRSDSLAALSGRLQERFPDVPAYALGRVEGLLGARRRADGLARARAFNRQWPDRALAIAEVLRGHGEFRAAIDYVRQQADRSQDRLACAKLLVEFYEQAGEPVRAVAEVVEIANAEPAMLANWLGRLSSYSARADLRRILGELGHITDPAARARAQAAAYAGAGRDEDAVRVLKPVLRPQELYQFGREVEGRGVLGLALAAYAEVPAHSDRARVLRQMGRTDEALAALARDSGPGANFELAELHRLARRDYAAAAAAYRRALSRRPGEEPALHGLAAALLGLGELDSAVATLGRIRRQTDRTLLLRAKLEFLQGRMDTCAEYVKALTTGFPGSFLANDGLELTMLTLAGDRAAALARAVLDYETGNDDAARREAQGLARGDDAVAGQAYLLWARTLRRGQRPAEALAVLDSALARPGTNRLGPRLKLEQAYIYREEMRNEAGYRQVLEALAVQFPGTPYAPLARSLIAELDRPAEPGSAQ